MNCFLCDQPMVSGHTRWLDYYGQVKRIAHKTCDRDALIARARELGLLTSSWPGQRPENPGQRPENHSDQVIADAIAAELLSGEWLARLERLPTDEAKRDAVHRLRLSMESAMRSEQ